MVGHRAGSPVRYGVIGTGMMGREHIDNIGHLDGAVVTAIADPWPASRAAAAAMGDGIAVFESHEHLLAADLCDVVVIATPNHTHAHILDDVLDHEVHVLVEKPLCTTIEDCRRIVERVESEASDRIVWMGLEYRYMPPTRELLGIVRAGELGEVRMVAIREHRFPFLDKVDNWNRFAANTGGTLVEKCCHFFDLMSLIVDDEPVAVMASGGQDVNHLDEVYDGQVPDIADNAFVIVEYSGGRRAILDLCMFAEASVNEQEISVVGDRGKAECLVSEGLVRFGQRSGGRTGIVERAVDGADVRYQGLHHGASYLEHVDLLDAIRSGGTAKVTVRDGLAAVAVGVAAQQSIAERRIVALEEVL